MLFNAAMLLGALGVIGDLLAAQRTLSQRTFERVRRIELQLGVKPSHYEPGNPAAHGIGRIGLWLGWVPAGRAAPAATIPTRRHRTAGQRPDPARERLGV